MTLNALGIEVPGGGDEFDPQGDMVAMAASFGGRLVVPVASVAARNALATTLGAGGLPLYVTRADAAPGRQLEYSTDGTTWTTVVAGDTGYVTAGIVAASGWTLGDAAGYRGLSYRIAMGMCFVYGVATKASYVANEVIATLPAAARPERIINNGSGGNGNRVDPDGSLRVLVAGTANTIVYIMYPLP